MHPTFELLDTVLAPDECDALLSRADVLGFTETGRDYPPAYRNNDRLVFDDPALAQHLFARLRHRLPSQASCAHGRGRIVGLNPRFRMCRYRDGQAFCVHQDGAYEPTPRVRSILTCQLSLSDPGTFAGGHTRFYASRTGGLLDAIRPTRGSAIVFAHAAWHDGEPVTAGTKIVLRTDVVYEGAFAPPSIGRTVGNHRGYVFAVEPLADGRIATGSRDRAVRIFRGAELDVAAHDHTAAVSALAEVAPGIILSGSRDRTLRELDARTGSQVIRSAEAGAVLAVRALGNGRHAVATSAGTIGIDDRRVHAHDGWVWSLAVTADRLISGAETAEVSTWTHDLAPVARRATSAPVRALVVLGDQLAAGLASGDVELFGLADLCPLGRFHAHDGAIHDMCAVIAAPHATASLTTTAAGLTTPGSVLATTGIATAGNDGFARRFDGNGREVARIDHGCFVSAIRPLPTGEFITGAYDGVARILDLAPLPLISQASMKYSTGNPVTRTGR